MLVARSIKCRNRLRICVRSEFTSSRIQAIIIIPTFGLRLFFSFSFSVAITRSLRGQLLDCLLKHQSVTEKIEIYVLMRRFEQTGPTSGTCHQGEEANCVGGFARVYTAVSQLVNERPNAIFLNAGDHFQGTLWYNIHRWNVTAKFMNMLPHDVMVIIC